MDTPPALPRPTVCFPSEISGGNEKRGRFLHPPHQSINQQQNWPFARGSTSSTTSSIRPISHSAIRPIQAPPRPPPPNKKKKPKQAQPQGPKEGSKKCPPQRGERWCSGSLRPRSPSAPSATILVPGRRLPPRGGWAGRGRESAGRRGC